MTRRNQTYENLEIVLDSVDGQEEHFNWNFDGKERARQIAEGREFLEGDTACAKVLNLEFLLYT